jgi:hypothetical protein
MIALDETRTAIFDANGIARITLLPKRAREAWKVWRYSVTTTSTATTNCFVYVGSEQSGTHIDFSATGNNDISENVHGTEVDFGRSLVFVWNGGTPGAVAFLSLVGEVVKR